MKCPECRGKAILDHEKEGHKLYYCQICRLIFIIPLWTKEELNQAQTKAEEIVKTLEK